MDFSRLKDATLVVVALTYGLLLALAARAGLFGLLLLVMVMLSSWRFGYEVLKYVAQGRTTIPAPGIETMNPVGDFRLVLHFGFFAGLFVLLTVSPLFDGASVAALSSRAVLALLVAAFPASAALMALTSDLGAAMNPRAIFGLVRILGRRYLLLLGACAVLALLSRWIESLALLGILRAPLSRSFDVWAVLAVFCVTGAALRARRDALAIPGERVPDDERRAHELRAEWRQQTDLAYASIRSGLAAEGYRTIRKLLEQADMSVEAHQWVLDEMLSWEDRTHALELARSFIERLIAEGDPYRALELASRCRGIGHGVPLGPATLDELAAYARSIGKQGLADDLVERARLRQSV